MRKPAILGGRSKIVLAPEAHRFAESRSREPDSTDGFEMRPTRGSARLAGRAQSLCESRAAGELGAGRSVFEANLSSAARTLATGASVRVGFAFRPGPAADHGDSI